MIWVSNRYEENRLILDMLLGAPKIPFDHELRSALPEQQGLYAITVKTAEPGEFLRAGKTKTAQGGLRQRIYHNHLMGSQKGNLRRQLVLDGKCSDTDAAKEWIKRNCDVQFLIVDDYQKRTYAEYFMLSMIRPRYCD